MKKCSKCGEEKAFDQFPKSGLDRKGRPKFKSFCKPCGTALSSEKWAKQKADPVWIEKYRERDREKKRKARALNPGREAQRCAKYRRSEKGALTCKRITDERSKKLKQQTFLKNVGSFVAIRSFACRGCGELKIKRGANGPNICTPCFHEKGACYGLSFERKQIEATCSDCGVVHMAKAKSASCVKCAKRRAKFNQRKREKEFGKTFKARCRKHNTVWTPVNRMEVFRRDKWLCSYCGVRVILSKVYTPTLATIDHVIPISKGGNHTIDNVVTACIACNSIKSDKLIQPSKARAIQGGSQLSFAFDLVIPSLPAQKQCHQKTF